jgi:holo-[acyl-carrier protein] synthase
MIQGIGIDLIEIERFRKMKNNREFIPQVLTDNELKQIPTDGRHDIYIATLFAIKEAIFKALGCGLHNGSYWHNVELDKEFKPTLSGFIDKLALKKSIKNIFITKSQSKKYIITFAILES